MLGSLFFDKHGSGDWHIRRRYVQLVMVYCGAAVAYLIVYGPDDELRRAAMNGLILLAGATLQGYLFGVIVDDKNKSTAPAGSTTETKQTVVTAPPEQPPKVEIKPEGPDLP